MKTRWILFIVVALILGSCNGQEKQSKKKVKNQKNLPQETIKVNKEYDKDSNLIRYDSTYSYFYSNIQKSQVDEDSIFNNFRKMFEMNYPFSYKPYFNDMFFEDSLMKYDFYKKDFFTERFRHNMEYTEKMFQEMDSLKNKFFMDQFPAK